MEKIKVQETHILLFFERTDDNNQNIVVFPHLILKLLKQVDFHRKKKHFSINCCSLFFFRRNCKLEE